MENRLKQCVEQQAVDGTPQRTLIQYSLGTEKKQVVVIFDDEPAEGQAIVTAYINWMKSKMV